MAAPADAARKRGADQPSPYASYVRARAADVKGDPALAASEYAAALAAHPTEAALMVRTFRQAILAGDRDLAMRAAHMADAAGQLPPDGRLLFLAETFGKRDWAGAAPVLDALGEERLFSFMLPLLRAWITFEADPAAGLAQLEATAATGPIAGYLPEHRVLMMLASGQIDRAAASLSQLGEGPRLQQVQLRLLVAQALAAGGDKAGALALLKDGDEPVAALRQQIERGDAIKAPVIDPSFALSSLLLRVASDLSRTSPSPLPLALVRIASFAAPTNDACWLAVGQFLDAAGLADTSLDALSRIGPDSIFYVPARATRIRVLVGRGDEEAALAEMQAEVRKADVTVADWTMLGDILMKLDRHAEAADAYRAALRQYSPSDKTREWSLWLLLGGALERGGNWPEAQEALEKAVALGPDEPVALNYLGYAQLERRQNVERAHALIERASELRPDDAAITDSLGWALYLRGDIPAAIEKLETAARGDPGGSEINEHLGDVYWAAGRRIDARFAWQAAMVNAQSDDAERIRRKIDFGPDQSAGKP